MKRWIKNTALGLLALLTSALLLVLAIVPLATGWMLRSQIREAIDTAKDIVVIEHSDRFDPNRELADKYEERIFKSVKLSAEQVRSLREALPLSFDYSYALKTLCIFSSHHRVEFHGADGQTRSLEICFHCEELTWDGGSQRILPRGWDASLTRYIESLGMTRIPRELRRE